MKRRSFLSTAAKSVLIPTAMSRMGMSALVPGVSPLAHAMSMLGDTDKVLVLVYLNGGNDGLNTVVPLDQLSNLSAARPDVILPENRLLRLDGTAVGLHPSLGAFKDLYDEGRLQIIQNVGYPEPDFSHFRSTDIWMSGSDSDQIVTNGWTGRYLDREYPDYPIDYPNENAPDPLAIEIGYGQSLLFQGPVGNMGMVIRDPEYFYELIENEESTVPDTPAGDRLAHVRLMARQSQQYGAVVVEAAERVTNQRDYPAENYLAEQLKVVSRLIAGGLQTRLYLVSYGGFDTHDSQVEPGDHTQGTHAYLLEQVSEAIGAFMQDLDHLGTADRVMGMTFSEFGRRINSNASVGTDHGTAAPMFLFGNHVAGGVIGNNPVIPSSVSYDDNLEMEYDFRSVYSSIFEQWFCLSPQQVSDLMLGSYDTLAVTSSDQCGVTSTTRTFADKPQLSLAPNPAVQSTTIRFSSTGGVVEISLFDLAGKLIKTFTKAHYPEGDHTLSVSLSGLPSGQYAVIWRQERFRANAFLIKH